MCGICGFIQTRPIGPESEELILAMRDAMAHRGPDGAGERRGERYALGHRRLSIVDLSAAATQPMSNEDGRVWVTFNGEIYNHLPIREELIARGHVFHSRSDTEVLVHGWEEWGADLLGRLNGMFAFVIADERTGQTFIARDRLGIKPLYYFQAEGVFAFASEVKGLLEHPQCPRRMRHDVLGEQLLFRNIAGERTLFDGIYELDPGCYLVMERDLKPRIQRYWQVEANGECGGDPDYERFQSELRAAVDRWMMSDVPVGSQLSGGVDSSIITRLSADLSPYRMKSFSIGFSLAAYNEFPYSNLVAKAVGTDHRPILAEESDFERQLDRLVELMDVPVDHPNSLLLYLLCVRAREEVTVLLTGEGADELLCGYTRYSYFDQVYRKFQRIPGLLHRAVGALPPGALPERLRRLGEWSRRGPLGMAVMNSAFGSRKLLASLNEPHALDLSVRENMLKRFAHLHPLDALLRLDQQVYMVSLLQRQDRISMGAGVEARVPFLDHEFVEMVNRLPLSHKLRGGAGKHILTRMAADLLPPEISQRSKMGFPIPIREWFRKGGQLSDRLDVLLESNSLALELFARPAITGMVESHRAGTGEHAEDLWILLALESWHRRFIRRSPSRPRRLETIQQ